MAVTLLGCTSVGDPNDYLVGQQSGQNLYEFGVLRLHEKTLNSSNVYRTQRDHFARELCPQGYEIVSETTDFTIAPHRGNMTIPIRVRIACPAV